MYQGMLALGLSLGIGTRIYQQRVQGIARGIAVLFDTEVANHKNLSKYCIVKS